MSFFRAGIGKRLPRLTMVVLAAVVLTSMTAAELGAAGGEVLRPNSDDVALRAAPALDGRVIKRLGRDDRLLLFERRSDWLRVGVFGAVAVEGWVKSTEVAPQPRAKPPPAPPIPPGPEPVPRPLPVFHIHVAGTPGLKFRGSCETVGRDGQRMNRPFRGLAPEAYRVRASAVACRVDKEDFIGDLVVTLEVDGRRLASAGTSAPLNYVRVRSDGPWGRAAGWRGSKGLVVPR